MKGDDEKFDVSGTEGQSGSPGTERGETPHREGDPYRAVFMNAPDGILLVDRQGRVVEANREAERLFGYGPGELVGIEVESLVPPEVRGDHQAHREAYARRPRPRPMGIGLELAGVRRDGTRVPVEISLSPFREGGEDLVISVVRDLTERRRLRSFGADAVRAAEEERRRIARELHDDTAQRLAAMILRLRVLEKAVEETDLGGALEEFREELHQVVDGVRRIARGLRPPELEDVGLEAALRAHVRERTSQGRVRLELGDRGTRLSEDAALSIYRIAQEALGNALRHSHADVVVLRTAEREGTFVLEVADDGAGFDPSRLADPGAGLGLVGMRERAVAVGGSLEVLSSPGDGTRVRLKVPLPAAQDVRGEELTRHG
jgi:PAS domain S-box-containing protein